MGGAEPWVAGALLVAMLLIIARVLVELLEGLGQLYNAIARRMGFDIAESHEHDGEW